MVPQFNQSHLLDTINIFAYEILMVSLLLPLKAGKSS